jgi:DNA-binding transcriptional ArsR family regulator
MIEFTVSRQLAQRRNPTEAAENVEYLANLPRSIGFKLSSVNADAPVASGLLWEYKGVLRYEPKGHLEPDRLAKDEAIIFNRIKRACEHKRWGRSPWHVERTGDAPTNGSDDSANPSVPSDYKDVTDEEQESIPSNLLSGPGEPGDEPVHHPVRGGVELVETPQVSGARRSTSVMSLPDESMIREVAGKLAKIGEPSKLKIIYVLSQQERNVTDLCADLGSQSQPAVSHHLSILRHSRLVDTERDGQHNYYHLTDEGRQLAEIVKQLVG